MDTTSVGIRMNEWELVAVISFYSKYGKTRLLGHLERRLKDLRRYKYPERGKKREYTIDLQ